MSGLDPDSCVILEIATIITDANLRILAEGPNLAVRQGEHIISAMDDWNQAHHGRSGLIDRCRRSQYSLEDCEKLTLQFVKPWTVEKENPLCGNSIGQDRRFLYKYMVKLSSWLNYRSVDVTSIKELVGRWYPQLPPFKKEDTHQALVDIRESISELDYYRKTVFVQKLP